MLLTIDVGNTNSVLGVFRGEELIANWRLTTAREQTIDEYGVLTRNLFTLAGLDWNAITGVAISSVVPPVNRTFAEMSRIYFGKKALFVEMGVKTGMAVLVDNPSEVGADRIVNGVAAFHQYGGPCIVVDFGTAITFDAISAKGEYLGGVIAPGLGISSEALFARAARLPRVEIKDPGKVIGTNTITHMQAGLYYGAVDMVDGMLARMKKELAEDATVVATGGEGAELSRGQWRRKRDRRQRPDIRRRPINEMDGWNYFNYFTEIEEYFWKKRGAHLLVSPLDWAIMEAWQKAGVPLEAALKGIDKAFESYQRSRRGAGKPLKNLAYCTDAVLEAAEDQQAAAAGSAPKVKRAAASEAFSRDELKTYFAKNAAHLKRAAEKRLQQPQIAGRLAEIAESLESSGQLLDAPGTLDLEDLERRLTILDEKIHALLTSNAPEELMLKIRREVDGQLAMYRRNMKAEQLAMVEKQYVQKRLLEEFGIPRLSLFYLS